MSRRANRDLFASVFSKRRGEAARRREDAERMRQEAALQAQALAFLEEHQWSDCGDFEPEQGSDDAETTILACWHENETHRLTVPTAVAERAFAAAYEKHWGRPKQYHEFDDDFDYCTRCGLSSEEAVRGGEIGCEATPEGNVSGYPGLALTPEEQAQGVTLIEKHALFEQSKQLEADLNP
jgi:hypothetical protein